MQLLQDYCCFIDLRYIRSQRLMMQNSKLKGYVEAIISSATFGTIPLFSIPVLAAGMQISSLLVYRFGFACLLMTESHFGSLSVRDYGSVSWHYSTPFLPFALSTAIIICRAVWQQRCCSHTPYSQQSLKSSSLIIDLRSPLRSP